MNASNKISNPLCCLFLSAAFILGGCTEDTVEHKTVLRPVKSMLVISDSGNRVRVFNGTTHAAQEADLSFKVSGTIKKIAVVVGDKVSPGDLIAELDPETYLVELKKAKASLAQSDATRRNMEAEYQRVRKLYANNNLSRNELDSALANSESAKASYDADNQQVRLAQLNLSYTRLVAESNCNVAQISVDMNENITNGTTVAKVNCGNRWEVKISVAEGLIAQFKNGLKGNVRFSAFKGESYTGMVSEVGITSSGSSTFSVTLVLDKQPKLIRSGLAAEVSFNFKNILNKTQIHLPPSAVSQDQESTFVYIMEDGEQKGTAILRRRAVIVGSISEKGLEITQGLTGGERVVTAGHVSARDGMLVRDDN